MINGWDTSFLEPPPHLCWGHNTHRLLPINEGERLWYYVGSFLQDTEPSSQAILVLGHPIGLAKTSLGNSVAVWEFFYLIRFTSPSLFYSSQRAWSLKTFLHFPPFFFFIHCIISCTYNVVLASGLEKEDWYIRLPLSSLPDCKRGTIYTAVVEQKPPAFQVQFLTLMNNIAFGTHISPWSKAKWWWLT